MDANRHPLWDLLDSRTLRQLWPILAFVTLGALILWNLSMLTATIPALSFSTFHHHLQAGHIARIDVQGETITGQFKPEFQKGEKPSTRPRPDFKTHIPSFAGQGLMQEILRQQVLVTVHPRSNHFVGYLLLAILPAALLACFVIGRYRAMRSSSPGQNSMHRGSTAQMEDRSRRDR